MTEATAPASTTKLAIDVYVSPLTNTVNRFTALQIDDLAAFGPTPKSIYQALAKDWGTPRRRKVLILNWYEDRLGESNNKPLEFVRSVVILSILKLRIKNIVWIRHNYWPHHLVGWTGLNKLYNKIIGLFSSITVTLRPVERFASLVVPSPLYAEALAPNAGAARDLDYLIIGTIRKNRGLDVLLQNWPATLPIKIAGRCKDPELKALLISIIAARQLQVDWTDEFISDEVLEGLLARTRFVVIPAQDNTAIVSGLLYHAASFGANVLLMDGEFFRFAARTFSFVQDLSKLGADAPPYVPPDQVMAEALAVNGREARLKAWSVVFDRLFARA